MYAATSIVSIFQLFPKLRDFYPFLRPQFCPAVTEFIITGQPNSINKSYFLEALSQNMFSNCYLSCGLISWLAVWLLHSIFSETDTNGRNWCDRLRHILATLRISIFSRVNSLLDKKIGLSVPKNSDSEFLKFLD